MSVTFTGLSSGIDTASLVDKLVASERAPATAIQSQQSDLNTQKSIVNSLSSALQAFGNAARAMNLSSLVAPRTASSSDSHVTVAATAGAAATVHDVRVQQLARGQITASGTFTSNAAGVAGTGRLQIQSGTASGSIDYDSTDTLASIASKINSANAGASASVLFDGTSYRLMVAATQTGTAAAPVFTETGAGLGLTTAANIKVPAKDAIATIDGVDVTRSTNIIGDALDGLTFTLNSPHATTDPSAAVSVALDNTALTAKLTTLVSSYNQVNAAIHVQLDYTGTTKGTNTLFGDSTLRGLQGAIGTLMSSGYGANNTKTLGAIGLIRDSSGNLTLDATKLSAALATNPNAVSDLFVTGGFATATTNLTDGYTRSNDGVLANKVSSISSRFKDLQGRVDQINSRADALKTQLAAQFTALETAMSSLKSQSAYLTSIFG